MDIGFIKATHPHERRVPITPETVKKFVSQGIKIHVEKGLGEKALITDEMYEAAGAILRSTSSSTVKRVPLVVSIDLPKGDLLKQFEERHTLICETDFYHQRKHIKDFAKTKATLFGLEFIPRITRAQTMDVLSSQRNLAGYKAVLEAANLYAGSFPMMMTAAGMIQPAKVLVLGAGVAGLQAIATAKRLGARVAAFDVRSVAKEQVESLGGRFVEVPAEETGDTASGYAREMSEEYKKKQSELLAKEVKESDIIITTALLMGKKAPVLLTREMIEAMKPGSVVVDIASHMGGNTELTKDSKIVDHKGVSVCGMSDLPSRLTKEASQLYARNVFHFISPSIKNNKLAFDLEDEVYKGTCVCRAGEVVNTLVKEGA